MPVKAVAVFARQSDIGLLVPADAGISGPAQLKGKKVAYTAGSLEALSSTPSWRRASSRKAI